MTGCKVQEIRKMQGRCLKSMEGEKDLKERETREKNRVKKVNYEQKDYSLSGPSRQKVKNGK